MPEGLEAEIWCRAAQPLVGRRLTAVVVDERVTAPGLVRAATGRRVRRVSRRGKVVLLHLDADGVDADVFGDTTPTPGGGGGEARVVGLHFGMTGRLIVDGRAAIERLTYASGADRPEWDRLVCRTDPAPAGPLVPALRFNDPRRLGRISLDPDLSSLGPDVLTVTRDVLAAALRGRRAAVKASLLDQGVVAGLGNLCSDEVLLHAGIAPSRPASSLTGDEVAELVAACRRRLPLMLEAGGSTHGDLSPDRRRPGGRCPLDDTELVRETIGGRTAVWCPRHQH